MGTEEVKAVARRAMEVVSRGTREDFDEVIHPDYVNHEAAVWQEPATANGRGPEAAWSTAQWLRSAFEDLKHDIREIVAEGELVAMHCVTSGRQIGAMRLHDESDAVADEVPASGKTFKVTQTHWVRIVDGKCIEHWANRDDLGTAEQLGWLPPGTKNPVRSSLSRGAAD